MKKQRIHREWFQQVSLGHRKSCPECKAKLEQGESIWSWGEYINAKFRSIQYVCKSCWPDVQAKLQNHASNCGCTFELVTRWGVTQPAWMQLPQATCNSSTVVNT